MRATKKLRRLLDERGVEWRMTSHYDDNETIFDGNGLEWYAREFGNDYVELRTARLIVTPEQAVEATVGRETCHLVETEHEREVPYDLLESKSDAYYTDVTYDCDECGYENLDYNVRYCGGCGRRVVK